MKPPRSFQMFPPCGEVNNVLNDFAEFIFSRKSMSEATEKIFVQRLESLQGITNTPMSMLQQRIDSGEVNYKAIVCSVGIVDEMKDAIRRHTNN